MVIWETSVNARRWIGFAMLAGGLPLMALQFTVAFSGPLEQSLHREQDPIAIALHVAPYLLFLVSLYLMLPRERTPGIKSPAAHALVTFLASWAAAGSLFLMAVVFCLYTVGPLWVEQILAFTPFALIIGAAAIFPVLYRRLR